MLQQIGHLFKYASLEAFSTILIYFIHFLDKIRLWPLEQVSPGVCILNLIHTAIIPTQINNSEAKMRGVGNLFWTYKLGLKSTLKNKKITQMYKEHASIKLPIARRTMSSAAVLKIKGEYVVGYEQPQINSLI